MIQQRAPLLEHSEQHVGTVWTAADHAYLVEVLTKIDELAQAIAALRQQPAARAEEPK